MTSFSELEEKIDSYGRCSYKLKYNDGHRKVIACEFSHTGNGYVYGVDLPDYTKLTDARGWVNIRDFSETELVDIVSKAINCYGGFSNITEPKSHSEIKLSTFKQEPYVNQTNALTLVHRMIRNITNFKQSDLRQKDFWGKKCEGFISGIYIYQFDNTSIPYPFGYNEVFYIGKAKNLVERLLWHFTVDNRKRLIEEEQCLEWFYQNYYQSGKYPFNIRLFNVPISQIDQVELLLIGMFALKFGATPLCNSSVGREKFKEIYVSTPILTKQFISEILNLIS